MDYGDIVQKVLDYVSWILIGLFALPTVLIIATWGSVPGDMGYGVKRAFEQSLLVIARPSYDTEAQLSAQYTKRRLEEAKALLANNQSSAGLSYLSQQVTATKKLIERAPTEEKKREAAKNYLSTLKTVSKELKAQQTKQRSVAVKTKSKGTLSGATVISLQSDLAKQIQEIQALQMQLEQQVNKPHSQQLVAQLAAQAEQLRQLQLQVQSQPAATQHLQQLQEQLESSQEETKAIVAEITVPEHAQQSQAQEVIDLSLDNTTNQIEDAIKELETIVVATSDTMPKPRGNEMMENKQTPSDNISGDDTDSSGKNDTDADTKGTSETHVPENVPNED